MKVYQSDKLTEIDQFFTQKSPVIHFLVLTIFFATVIVVFGQPTGLLVFTSQSSTMNPHLQITIATATGLLTLIVSRIALYFFAKWRSISPMGCLIWVLLELGLTMAVLVFTLWQVSGGGRLALASLAGDLLLSIIAIVAMPYVITYLSYLLRQKQIEVDALREQLDSLMTQDSPATDATTDHPVNFYDKGNRLVFSTTGSNLLYIEAADNYVNIHYLNEGHEDTFILHNTLKEMERCLADTSLMRCHRGYIVNINNVKLLRKEGTGLMLELTGSTKTIPVTKTYATNITEHLAPANN